MKVTEVLGEYDAKFGSKRYEFKVEGNDNKISGFSKYPIKVGDDINGNIVQKGEYFNWEWAKKNENGTQALGNNDRLCNLISLKVVPLLTEIRDLLSAQTKEDEELYPTKEDVPF